MEKQTWSIGRIASTVISDIKIKNDNFPSPPNPPESDNSDIEYYGGYLVCESIGNKEHGNLIAAAPDLLEALKGIMPFAEQWINANHPTHKAAIAAIKKATEQ